MWHEYREEVFGEGGDHVEGDQFAYPSAAISCSATMLPKEGARHYPVDDDQQVLVPVLAAAARAIERVNILHSTQVVMEAAAQAASQPAMFEHRRVR